MAQTGCISNVIVIWDAVITWGINRARLLVGVVVEASRRVVHKGGGVGLGGREISHRNDAIIFRVVRVGGDDGIELGSMPRGPSRGDLVAQGLR